MKATTTARRARRTCLSIPFAVLVVVCGCQTDGDGSRGAAPAAAPAAEPPAEPAAESAGVAPSDEVLSRLADADAADGTTDKVIHKCITCSLHMDGDPEYKAQAHGYEAHLCSEHCLYRFTRDPDKSVMTMKPPG